MSYQVAANIKDSTDYQNLISLTNEILRFRISSPKSDHSVTVIGRFYIKGITLSQDDQATLDLSIWPEYNAEPLITVPLESQQWTYTTKDDPREQVEIIYGLGESQPIYITPAMRDRYRALEGCRRYRDRLTLCATPEAYFDDWDSEYAVCGHRSEEHDESGCNHKIWGD
ncbi:MAG: hypothetical protein ACYC9S_13850, partial [Leptospirales bacterium]